MTKPDFFRYRSLSWDLALKYTWDLVDLAEAALLDFYDKWSNFVSDLALNAEFNLSRCYSDSSASRSSCLWRFFLLSFAEFWSLTARLNASLASESCAYLFFSALWAASTTYEANASFATSLILSLSLLVSVIVRLRFSFNFKNLSSCTSLLSLNARSISFIFALFALSRRISLTRRSSSSSN